MSRSLGFTGILLALFTPTIGFAAEADVFNIFDGNCQPSCTAHLRESKAAFSNKRFASVL